MSHEFDLIVERLELEFEETDPSIVVDVVRESAAYFENAPIQTFVPLLAEKRAREALRAKMSTCAVPFLALGA
ncbi:MAG: hypothetical protein ABI658_02905 [Acidimicrobiales bacterium]